jgi:hypothetical protein
MGAIRDEIVTPEHPELYKVVRWLPNWRWQTYALGVLFVFLVIVLESAYRAIVKRESGLEALRAVSSDLDLTLHDQIAYESQTIGGDNEKELPAAQAFILRVRNTRGAFLQNCQIDFGQGSRFSNHVCPSFDLRPGEYKDIAILRVWYQFPDRPAAVYSYYYRDGGWHVHDAIWMPRPGVYTVTAFSANTYPATLAVRLSKEGMNWNLLPSDEVS